MKVQYCYYGQLKMETTSNSGWFYMTTLYCLPATVSRTDIYHNVDGVQAMRILLGHYDPLKIMITNV